MATLATWCSGLGPRWAERRYSMVAEAPGIGRIEAATLWVHIDMATMKPIPVPADFAEQFAEAARGRTVKARLHLPSRPPDGEGVRTPWPLRFADFDVLGHVNNAAYWEAVEELLAERHGLRPPLRAVLEYGAGLNPDAACELLTVDEADGLSLWLVAGEVVAASARVYVSR
jgi:acyl-ACP thioesterase